MSVVKHLSKKKKKKICTLYNVHQQNVFRIGVLGFRIKILILMLKIDVNLINDID